MKNREDIQALRGLAVLLVLLYHFRLNLLEAGYLGVDIFFVISGFLITSLVTSQIQLGNFSFGEFYFRRAKRLLPAAYTTFLITALLSMWLLTSQEFMQLTQQLWGAVTFTGNLVLWRQGSYFGGEADLKPLLHTWSLAIEEQYYLLLPAALFFTPARHWYKGVIFVLLSSAVLCIGLMIWRPDVAFYFLPTRAWELAIGSLGVFLVRHPRTEIWTRRFFWPAIFILLFLPIQPLGNLHPGIDAGLVCCSTLIVILARHPRLNQGKVVYLLAKVGDWSYSLYLVHWPVIALASNVWVGDLPMWAKWVGVALSMVLAWLQYMFIENPIRHARIAHSWPRAAMIAFSSVVLMLVPFLFLNSPLAQQEYAYLRRGNTGLSAACAFNRHFHPSAQCQSSSDPKILVWGDSYAMHLVPGIKNEIGTVGLVQATKYVCGPLLGVAPVAHYTGATQNRNWSEECMDFNDSVIEYLKNTPAIQTVVLSSVFKQYMTPESFHSLERTDMGLREVPGSISVALQGIGRTVRAVRQLGKTVVVIAPPPAMDWDAGRCAERLLRNKPLYGKDSDCSIKNAVFVMKRKDVIEFLDEIKKDLNVEVIRFDDALRVGDRYRSILDDEIIYISNGHLSYRGSEILAKRMSIGDLILEDAR